MELGSRDNYDNSADDATKCLERGWERRINGFRHIRQPDKDQDIRISFVLLFFSDEIFLNHRKEPSSTDRRSLDPPWFTTVERSSSVPMFVPEPAQKRRAAGCETTRISSGACGAQVRISLS